MPVPGLQIAKRVLNFYYILDVSGSMDLNGRIQALNQSVRQSIPGMVEAASTNPNAEMLVHALTFGTKADWHIHPGVPVENFAWQDLRANGATSMGQALMLVCDELENNMPARSLPPVLVLVSDGHPTDHYEHALARLRSIPWGLKSVRIAIGMGPSGDVDWETMKDFMFDMDIEPLHAQNSSQLANYIRWASTVAVTAASTGQSGQAHNQIHLNSPAINAKTVVESGDVF